MINSSPAFIGGSDIADALNRVLDRQREGGSLKKNAIGNDPQAFKNLLADAGIDPETGFEQIRNFAAILSEAAINNGYDSIEAAYLCASVGYAYGIAAGKELADG